MKGLDPDLRALQEMRYVKACSGEGNPIARSELKLLESRQNGGPMPLTYELYR